MPVQINEVIIRTVVDAAGSSNAAANGCAPPGNSDGSESGMSASQNEIAEQVLQIIKEKNER